MNIEYFNRPVQSPIFPLTAAMETGYAVPSDTNRPLRPGRLPMADTGLHSASQGFEWSLSDPFQSESDHIHANGIDQSVVAHLCI